MNNLKQSIGCTTDWIVPFFLILTVFLIPLSSTGKSIALTLSLIAICITPRYNQQLINGLKTPWFAAICLFLCCVVFACSWSPASWNECFFSIKKYIKFLYLPVLAVGFMHERTREYSIYAFIAAMWVTSVLGILSYYGFLAALKINPDYIFRNHIMTGLMMAYASYLSLLLVWKHKTIKVSVLFIGVTLMLTYYLLVINKGRTGFVMEGLLLGLLVIQFFRWQTALILALCGSIILTITYLNRVSLQQQVHLIVNQATHYKTNPEAAVSSVGYRLRFHDFAYQLFKRHPLVGNGTASFPYYFDLLNPVPEWNHRLQEPHSQYWLIAAEQGIAGLVLLMLVFLALLQAIWVDKFTRAIGLGMIVAYGVGNLSDSLLFYSGSGYCFLILIALCLGARLSSSERAAT